MYRVLVVDDELPIRQWLETTIRRCVGYDVMGAFSHGKQALLAMEKEWPDLIITDIRMPVMDGIEFIRQVRARDTNLPILVFSSHEDFGYARQALALGVSSYILKTEIEQDSLERWMENAIRQSEERQTGYRHAAPLPQVVPEKPAESEEARRNFYDMREYDLREEKLPETGRSVSRADRIDTLTIDFNRCLMKNDLPKATEILDKLFAELQIRRSPDLDGVRQKVAFLLRSLLYAAYGDQEEKVEESSRRYGRRTETASGLKALRLLLDEAAEIFSEESAEEYRYSCSIARVREYIREHYAQPISLKALAAVAELSPEYLSRLFKEECGINYSAYLTNIRLNRALELLEQSSDKVYEIAEKVGIANLSYFSLSFKKKFGKNPQEYRRGLRR